ncbi:Hpt domain-containing protein [Oligoflexia bacterium]|nr:Hpt domain-containing protein [Oligoflexia bacterium]
MTLKHCAIETNYFGGTMEEYKVFDVEAAMDRVESDKELLLELIDIFNEEYEPSLTQIKTAIENGDGTALEESAHSIKSALGNIGAMKAFDVAYALEKAGRENTLDSAAALGEALESAVADFQVEVTSFRNA